MKKIVITAILSIVLGVAGGWLMFHPGSQGSSSKERKILLYRDPMNPQNTSPTPKKASDGMDFVPVYEGEGSGTGEKKIAYYKDPMHPWYTSDKPGKAPDCGMDLVPVYESEGAARGIKIDPVTVQNIGVKIEKVIRRKLTKTVRAMGRVDYDERKIYSVNTKIMGWAEDLYVDYVGKLIHEGEPLMELYSPELVSTQEEYLQALGYRKKLQGSSLEEVRKSSDELVQSAKRRLKNWDISDSEIKELEERGKPEKTMTIYSPADGIVMEKMVQKGQNVMAGMELYKIADLSTVWIFAEVYQDELPWMKVGERAEIELSYIPGKSFKGLVTYIYPYMSTETRTAKIRIEMPNTTSLELKPEMYATVRIVSPLTVNAVAVPDQAIIRSGERNIAVMSLGGGYFEPREVKLGVAADGYVQILEGIREGENIVVSSQFLIDSESNLKAAIGQMAGHAGVPARQDGAAKGGGDVSMPKQHQETREGEHQTGDSVKVGGHTGHQMKGSSPSEIQSNGSRIYGSAGKFIDPVCGMKAKAQEELSSTYKGTKYYFCSADDLEKFKADPARYTTPGDKQ